MTIAQAYGLAPQSISHLMLCQSCRMPGQQQAPLVDDNGVSFPDAHDCACQLHAETFYYNAVSEETGIYQPVPAPRIKEDGNVVTPSLTRKQQSITNALPEWMRNLLPLELQSGERRDAAAYLTDRDLKQFHHPISLLIWIQSPENWNAAATPEQDDRRRNDSLTRQLEWVWAFILSRHGEFVTTHQRMILSATHTIMEKLLMRKMSENRSLSIDECEGTIPDCLEVYADGHSDLEKYVQEILLTFEPSFIWMVLRKLAQLSTSCSVTGDEARVNDPVSEETTPFTQEMRRENVTASGATHLNACVRPAGV